MSNYTFGFGMQIPNLNDLLLEHIGYKENGAFVEVGAFDCYHWSNTYGLAQIGWKGLYFEPQLPEYYKCVERFRNHPNITVLNMALSNWQGTTNLFLGGSLSTISEKQKEQYLKEGWSKSTGLADGKVQRVHVSMLAHELGLLGWPASYDLLVVDVEGSEFEVLQGNDIEAHTPTMAIVETHAELSSPLAHKKDLVDQYFSEFGYTLIQQDYINSIYVKE